MECSSCPVCSVSVSAVNLIGVLCRICAEQNCGARMGQEEKADIAEWCEGKRASGSISN